MMRCLLFICLACVLGPVATTQDKKAQAKDDPPAMEHKGWIHSLAFSPDGKALASVSDDETVRLWDVATGEELHHWLGHRKRVFCVAISHDGKMVASGDEDGVVCIWEIGTGKILNKFQAQNGTLN